MKRILILITLLINSVYVFSQSPQEELARLVESYRLPTIINVRRFEKICETFD